MACDLNEGMLDEARRHDVGGAPVEWRRADAMDLPFEAGSFDAVLCQQGLQFIPDRPAAGETMLATTGLGETQELFDLFTSAGFSSVEVHSITINRDPVDVVDAVAGNLASLPIADEIKSMDPTAQTQMVADIVEDLADYTTDGELTAPNRSNIAVAIA